MTPVLDVILAEDNIVQRAFLARMIERLGYRIIEAEDGREALELVRTTGAQILVSDYHMPYLNGIELARAVRGLELDHYVYIILITSTELSDLSAEALEAGADDFLPKGSNQARLQARMRAASRMVSHAGELAEQHRILKEANERIQQDLKAAALAQRQLLPDLHKDILGVHIASAFVPSAGVSGDMFGCFALPDNKLCIYAVDVAGHGINASLLSVAIGHLITPEYFGKFAFDADGAPDPASLISNLNLRFCFADSDNYFTMFCAIIDVRTGDMDICQAGYPSPVCVATEGDAHFIGAGGFPVGMFPYATFENVKARFDVGGLLVICSDAAPEAEDPQGTPFGDLRLRELVARVRSADADGIPNIIINALNDWRGGKALEDDLTVLALKRTKARD